MVELVGRKLKERTTRASWSLRIYSLLAYRLKNNENHIKLRIFLAGKLFSNNKALGDYIKFCYLIQIYKQMFSQSPKSNTNLDDCGPPACSSKETCTCGMGYEDTTGKWIGGCEVRAHQAPLAAKAPNTKEQTNSNQGSEPGQAGSSG